MFYKDDYAIPVLPHYHKAFELIYIEEGELEITAAVAERAIAGTFAMIPSNYIHSYKSIVPAKTWICKFSADYVPGFASYMVGKCSTSLLFSCDETTMAYLRLTLFADERLLWEGNGSPFAELQPEERALRLLMAQGYVHIICSHYAKQAKLLPREDKKEILVRKLVHYVSDNFRNDITLLGAAEALGYSYDYLSRYFNQGFMVNFKQFVNQHRLAYARKLICEDKMSVEEAAFESGFGTVRNFYHVCKKITGETPGKMK